MFDVFDEDYQARVELTSSLGHLLRLDLEAKSVLLKKFKLIDSNRELVNSLPEILESYF
ncbi:hypothetical protein SCRM01_195 [Synechococcus phage S-CRM01]|uniref:hypothetical protein n=1 Tax=Synechococcus phage S-CRM01 TaxID=1026955 RepID=UPI000209E414|nr:hypothetical protein SCRM01_195 [Synechococcus phage S-CRM01]AEC53141.1 hypothetical protein SCRM01_195 [Synechococcus phage S-CRM01]